MQRRRGLEAEEVADVEVPGVPGGGATPLDIKGVCDLGGLGHSAGHCVGYSAAVFEGRVYE